MASIERERHGSLQPVADYQELQALQNNDSYMPTSEEDAEPATATSVQHGGRQFWEPEALQRRSLFLFVICFFSIAIALPVMFVISERNQGLCTTNSRYYYLWTYGPTAVFTLILAFWSFVEYHAELITPWVLMGKGFTPASQSILLDYISSWNVLALYRSFRRYQFLVALPILGTLLIQLMVVFSTGLLAIQDTLMVAQVPVTVSQAFEGSGFQNGSNVDAQPFALNYGVQNFSLSYPFGTTRDYAFAEFHSLSSDATDPSLTADVDVLLFTVSCQEPQLLTNSAPEGTTLWIMMTPTCNATMSPRLPLDPSALSQHYHESELSCCHAEDDILSCTDDGEQRLIYYSVTESKNPPGELIHTGGTYQNLTRYRQFFGLVCSGHYNISRASVTSSGGAGNRNLIGNVQFLGSETTTLPLVSGSDILNGAYQSYVAVSHIAYERSVQEVPEIGNE